MDVKIRKAFDNELKTIQNLNYQLFEHDLVYDPLLKMDWPYTEGSEYFKKRISGEEGVCFVAEVDGRIVGYLAGDLIKPYSYRTIRQQTELENTLVIEEYRSNGIGKLLIDEFVKWSKERGAERIKVSASSGNSLAIQFYKGAGFADYATELEFEVN